MARIFMFGGEDGSLSAFSNISGGSSCSSTQKRTGSYSLYLPGNEYTYAANLFASSYAELYVRVGLYPTGRWFGMGADSHIPKIVCFNTGGGTPNLMFGLSSSGVFQLAGNNDDTILAAGTHVFSNNTWHLLEMHVKIADSPDGIFELKVNGVTELTYTGDTYRAPDNISYVKFGWHKWYNYTDAFVTGYYDDIAINDTTGSVNNSWIGQGGIRLIKPNGAGANTGLTPSTGDNYACVDEVPASDTDYVSGSTVDAYDLYALDKSTLPAAYSVSAVKWIARAKVTEDAANITPVIRSEGTTEQQADIALSTSFTHQSLLMNVDPIDNAAWTKTKIDNLQIGAAVG